MPLRRSIRAALIATLLGFAQPSSGTIYVANQSGLGITIHADDANGNVLPQRYIYGEDTAFSSPKQIYADVVHSEIFVANHSDDSILVFPLQAAGNQPPIRVIKGAATLLDEPDGVAVDLVHDELVVTNFADGTGSIEIFPRTANGNVAPLRRIAGPNTLLNFSVDVAIDPVANEIFVPTQGSGAGSRSIHVFSRTANGNVAPLRSIVGPNTLIDDGYGIFVDRAGGEIFLTDRKGSISVFPRTASGNVAPLRRIAGAATTLDETLGIGLIGVSEIVVSNGGLGGNVTDDSILVFPRNANGNVAPTRRINGPATGISGPNGVASVQPRLGLRGGRFGVQAVFRTQAGVVGDATPVQLTSDTGYFWFFQSANVELVVKVLDACLLNSRFWVFAGGLTDTNVDLIVTDYATGQVRSYVNPLKAAFQPIQDTDAFATCNAAPAPVRYAGTSAGAVVAGELDLEASIASLSDQSPITASSVVGDALFLNNERFEVRAEWEKRDGSTGVGHPVAITGDTGYFWFFQQENVEMVVKVLNACAAANPRYWVFAGGLTDVEVVMTVKDKVHGTATRTYVNPQRSPFQPIQDTSAFATCP